MLNSKASALMERILKTSTVKQTEKLLDSIILQEKPQIATRVPMLNLSLGGRINGGLSAGITTIAGPSRHFKTSFALVMVAAFLDADPEAICIFLDNEFGAKKSYFEQYGVDPNRVIHIPFSDIEELTFEVVAQLNALAEKDKVVFLIDSVGNAASKRELDNAIAEKSALDMTRAKSLKAFFRMVTPILNIKDIPMIAVCHTYQTQEMFSKTVVGGGCVVAGTKIIMSNGTTKNIEDVVIGDMVKTRLGDNKVIATWNPDSEGFDGLNRDCFEIEFSDGYKVTCTTNHKFYNGSWIDAQHLNVDDFVNKLPELKYKKQFHTTNGIDYVADISCNNRLDFIERDGDEIFTFIKSIKYVGKRDVYDISVDGEPSYVLETGILSHNTGIMYSSNTVLVIGKNQLKEKEEVTGSKFIIKIEKSRYVKEKSQFPITVRWNTGIAKWSGFEDIAEKLGIIQPTKIGKSGAYSYCGIGDKTITSPASTIDSDDAFWTTVIDETDLIERMEALYRIGCTTNDNVVFEEEA